MSVFPTKILVATDGSEYARPATEAATDLARRSRSELHVVHVWHDVPGFAHAFVKRELRRQGQEILDEEVRKIEASGGTVTRAHLRGGRTSDEIIELCEELEVGLLVVGSRGLGTVRRILMGSHSEEIVHHARDPVLVVRSGESAWPPSRIVIGEDFSGDARKAGELAASIGALYGSQALLVYARRDLPEGEARETAAREQDRLESRADELGEILGSRPEILVSDDHPAAALLEVAHQQTPPPVIAVGSRGIAGVRRTRLGSVSTKVVTASPGPVLVSPHVEQD
jgi:nucleotide-binding universal stress UspA family protein